LLLIYISYLDCIGMCANWSSRVLPLMTLDINGKERMSCDIIITSAVMICDQSILEGEQA